MEAASEIEVIRNEVLRKIGRNVVLFQQLEWFLKGITAMQTISAPVSQLVEAHAKSRESVDRFTMGVLVGKIKERLYVAPNQQEYELNEIKTPAHLAEASVSTSFQIESDQAFVDSRAKALSQMVEQRNDLIHKLIPKWRVDSIESSKEMEAFLNAQADVIRGEIEHFRLVAKSISDLSADFKRWIDSDEGKKAFEQMLSE